LCGAAATFEAGGRGAARLDVKTNRVVVFKDGYARFIKQAIGKTDQAATALIEDVPERMVLGSFWAEPKSGRLTSITSAQHIMPRGGRQETERSMRLAFDPERGNQEVEVELSYISPGIRWIPTYRIALQPTGQAELAMQAEILNEVEDLVNVPLDLVVGVPNIRFREVVSPLSLMATLDNPLLRAAPQLMGQPAFLNALMSQRSGETRGRQAEEPPPNGAAVPALPAELAGEGAQDLFVFHVPNANLRAGQRAAIPLVATSVPYRHLYTWDVRLQQPGSEPVGGSGAHATPVRLLKNEIWHHVEMTNKTDVPWTTGAALVVEGSLPLGQELLTYTSIGGKCQLPLTVAVDVRGTYTDEEVGRKPRAIHLNGHDYTRVSKKGTLRVTNYKTDPIDLVLTCNLGGNATKASDDATITIGDFAAEDWAGNRGQQVLTGHSRIQWTLKVDAGQTREATCEYEYFTR